MKVITISGACGSGKSSLAMKLTKSIETLYWITKDDYYLSAEEQMVHNGFCDFDNPAAINIGYPAI